MKIPLRFQMTEFDCGSVSLQNAISFLFEREEIPAEIIRMIYLYTLDCYDKKGNIGQGGTSKEAIGLMVHWLKDYAKKHNFNINLDHYLNNDVNLNKVLQCLDNNGCVLLRTYELGEHYVLITGYDDENIYVWDPYYLDEEHYDSDNDVFIILDKPFSYNRIVKMSRFIQLCKKDYCLGPIDNREIVVFNRVNDSKIDH